MSGENIIAGRRFVKFRAAFLLCGFLLQLVWSAPGLAQTEYWGPPYDNGWDGKDNYQSAGSAVEAYINEVQAGCNKAQAPSVCFYTTQYKDPYKNGGWAAWVLLEIHNPDGSVYKSSSPDYITATSHSNDVTKNVGGSAVCPCQKSGEGNSAAASSARGGAGDDAMDSKPIGPFTVQEGDPINAATGNKYQQDTDFRGSSWLTFRRFYNSIGYVSQAELGPQWRHSFDRSLEFIQLYGQAHVSTIYLYRPDASREAFTYTNGVWVSGADSADTLTENLDGNGNIAGYTVTIAALRHTENYNAAGLLQSVTDPTGQGITLTYSTISTPSTVAPKPDLLLTVTDAQSRQLSFSYNSQGSLSQVTLPDGGTLIYGYNATSGLLTSVQYPDGKNRQYIYNESSLTKGNSLPNALTGVIDEAGVRYESTGYNYYGAVSSSFAGGADATTIQSGQMQGSVTAPLGVSITFDFKNTLGALKPSSSSKFCGLQCNQSFQSITYDANGNPSSTTDFKNVVTKTTYDANGLLDQEIDASGTANQRTIKTNWNIPQRVPLTRTVLDNNGNTVAQMAWVYNVAGQPTAQCQTDPTIAAAASYTCATTGTPAGGVRRSIATYCTAVDTTQCPLPGLLLSTTGPRTDLTQTTTYTYYLTDSATAKHGDLQSITDALDHVTTYASYDGAGRVTRIIDPNGVITDLTYTPRGWLATRTVRALASGAASSNDAVTTIGYTPYGAVASITDPDGIVTTYGYDTAHRLTSIADAFGNTIQYTLDASGNRTKEQTFAAGAAAATRTLSRKFNTLGQLTTVTDGLGQAVFNASGSGNYDANGNLVQSADALGYQRKQGYDALNRLVSTIDNYNGNDTATKNTTSSLSYDALDRLTSVIDPSSLKTSYVYDGLGNGASLQSPDTGTSTGTFDAAGNRLTYTDAKGVVSTSTYDALDRLTSTSYTDTTLNVAYHYDEANTVTGCAVSSPVGRLTRVVENAVTTTYCYDTRGNVIQKRQLLGSTLDTTSYGYTLANRLQTTVNPDSTTTTYGRDADGRINSVTVSPPMGAAVTAVNAITYRPFGPISSYTLGNGQVITRAYDANDALTDLTSPTLNLHFARDAMGHIKAEGATAGANPATETYSYDPLYRLTTIADGTTNVEGLTYNPTGDRLGKTGSGLGVGNYTYTSGTHQLNRIGNAARTSDANGNTTASASAGQTWGYGYNGRNRLTVVQANGVTVGTYTYNALGQRIQKVATSPAAITQRYAYDEQGHLVGEYTGGNNRDTIWLGDIPVATVDTAGSTSTVDYVTADQLGTPRAVSDANGKTIWSWPYVGNPFGELAPTSVTGYVLNLRYPGQYYDAESGLMTNGLRTYCPECGRYLQSDPSGLAGGVSTYTYALNSPLQHVDPMGLWVCNGSPAQCSSFRNGLQSVQDASTSGNLAPYQQATLANIVNAYGVEGDSAVQIGFGSLGAGVEGSTGKNKNTGCETVTFDESKLRVPLFSQQLWGAAVAHEGQHVSDDIAGDVNNASNVSRYDTEVNAYTAQAYYDQAMQFADPSSFGKLWTSNGGVDYNVIQYRAGRSTNYAH